MASCFILRHLHLEYRVTFPSVQDSFSFFYSFSFFNVIYAQNFGKSGGNMYTCTTSCHLSFSVWQKQLLTPFRPAFSFPRFRYY